MILAELEFFHSRPIAPTRRVALGDSTLPSAPPPNFGGILLAGVIAANIGALDEDLIPEVERLMRELEAGRRVPQPRLRNRFQADRVGLLRARSRLVRVDGRIDFDFDDERSSPAQRLLAAMYAAASFAPAERAVVFPRMFDAMGWQGPIGPALISAIGGSGRMLIAATGHPVTCALEQLGFSPDEAADATLDTAAMPSRAEIQRRFRTELRAAHPDHGAAEDTAAERINDLRQARQLLLG